ncbi:MAG: tripartite tricarboxylate transporter substrate binding protein [Rhodospirillales bacterium]|nr:tripartite tricarboxylate transporter substrate binding protein [Rhodospirillales bacterium]
MKRLLLALCLACAAQGASARDFPDRTITVIVGFPPGSGPDVAVRTVTQRLSTRLGQPIIVDNRAGAAGTIGAAAAAHAPADGYTLLFGSASSRTVAPHLCKNLTYDTVTAFAPIVQMLRGAFILTVRADLPARDLKQLVAYAKERPGKLSYGSSGNGSLHHLCMELFNNVAGVNITHVPYKGSPPNWLALNNGEVDMICDSMPNPLPTLQSRKGRVLAITGDHRSDSLPDIPTFNRDAESEAAWLRSWLLG